MESYERTSIVIRSAILSCPGWSPREEGVRAVDETPNDSDVRNPILAQQAIKNRSYGQIVYSRLKVYNEPILKDFYDMHLTLETSMEALFWYMRQQPVVDAPVAGRSVSSFLALFELRQGTSELLCRGRVLAEGLNLKM